MDQDLNSWAVCDPDNRVDVLPEPYAMIVDVMQETILHKLNLSMHEIENKRKDENYEGNVKEYVAQNTIEIENICCLSEQSKTHNYLVVGDMAGQVYLLDLAKKVVFFKKELHSGRRVIHISETTISDGDNSITTLAVALNGHNKIYILRYLHSEPKLHLVYLIEVAPDDNNINRCPYSTLFDDYGRILFVYTYEGSILGYRVPQMIIDIETPKKKNGRVLEEQEVAKILKNPLCLAVIDTDLTKTLEKIIEIKFQGYKVPIKYDEMLLKLAKKEKDFPVQVEQVGKKDVKKKDEKKPENEEAEHKQQIIYNQQLSKRDYKLQNGNDKTPSYELPKYRPFLSVIHTGVELEKKKYFEKTKVAQIAHKIVYGWTWLKEFCVANLGLTAAEVVPDHLYIAHHLRAPKQIGASKQEYFSKIFTARKQNKLKNVFEITSVALSQPDELLFAAGLSNGTISIWNTQNLTLQINLDKHPYQVTTLMFFQSWKLISGSSMGTVHIDNVIENHKQAKWTQTFQPKVSYPICNIKTSSLGLAFVLDTNANMRVYDMWRNRKVARFNSCNAFAAIEDKGKRWIPNDKGCLYTNADFTVLLSNHWPNVSNNNGDREKIHQVEQLIANPWLSRTNIHVIRNFDLLLTMFEGLENTYKKGYERKKIENLFTNLEYVQLYDRHFDVPDFGVAPILPKKDKGETGLGTKSIQSLNSQTSRSKSKPKLGKQATQSKMRLTNEILHPQKFLFEHRKIPRRQQPSDESLMNGIRNQFQQKSRRQNILHNNLSKTTL